MKNPAMERWTAKADKPKRWSNLNERDLHEVMGYEDQRRNGNHHDRPATEVMAIIGLDDHDDLSTIANDTVVGQYVGPTNPRTPEKKGGSDHDTEPETPPKWSRSMDASRSYDSSLNGPSACFYKSLFIAVFFGVILFGAIAVLSLNLNHIRQSKDGVPSSSSSEQGASPDYNKPDYINPNSDGKHPFYDFSFATEAPANEVPTAATTPQPTRLRTSPPTMLRTASPTATPTKSPTQGPTIDLKVALRETILEVAPYSSVVDDTSVAFRVLAWLVNDPSFKDYTQAQTLQRFALGTFFWSLAEEDDITGNWMTYTDECTWKLTSGEALCDESGNVTSIYLEDRQLMGTLAPELSMLSDSLGKLFLTSNDIEGVLPSEFGQLTQLERLKLARNYVKGPLPSEIGLLTNLGFLGLGQNHLRGTLPTELGLLTNLGTLGLTENRFNGTIPTELSQLTRLSDLALESNFLTGEVPIINSTSLTTLALEQNDLTGTIPDEICSIPFVEITTDCGEIVCDCCLECSNSTSSGGTSTPIIEVPTDTNEPTLTINTTTVERPNATFFEPQSNPTSAPTTCASITTGMDCYSEDSIIDLMISNCDPQEFDMIGLYPDASGVEIAFPNAVFWVMSCDGDGDCSGVLADGMIYLENQAPEQLGFAPWPLYEGSYRLHLIRVVSTGVVVGLAASDSFRIVADSSC